MQTEETREAARHILEAWLVVRMRNRLRGLGEERRRPMVEGFLCAAVLLD